jgi:hypothetical protein
MLDLSGTPHAQRRTRAYACSAHRSGSAACAAILVNATHSMHDSPNHSLAPRSLDYRPFVQAVRRHELAAEARHIRYAQRHSTAHHSTVLKWYRVHCSVLGGAYVQVGGAAQQRGADREARAQLVAAGAAIQHVALRCNVAFIPSCCPLSVPRLSIAPCTLHRVCCMLDIGWCLLPLASCHVSRLLDVARCSLHASTMTRGVFCFSARHCWRSSRRLSSSLSNGERYTATQNNNVPAVQRTNAELTGHNLQRASNVVETVNQAGLRSLRKEAVQSACCVCPRVPIRQRLSWRKSCCSLATTCRHWRAS